MAQSIQILDRETNIGIEKVLLYDKFGNQSVSDVNGTANINELSGSFIILQHIGYVTLIITREQISNPLFLIPTAISVDEIVISANKWEEDISEIPVNVTKISLEKIVLQNPQTTADILNQSGEVFIQKSQLGGGSPMIRGFSANSILLSIDGIRMNNAIYRSGNLQNIISLDGLTTKSAEVVFGPGSVIYGSDALGGVIDFHTIFPQKKKIFGEMFSRFSSANLEKTGHIKLNLGGKKLAFLVAVTYSYFDDLIMGSVHKKNYPTFGTRPEYVVLIDEKDSIIKNTNIHKQVFSGYNQLNGLAKLSYPLSKNTEMTYAFHYTTSSNVPRYDRLTEYKNGMLKYAEWYYGPQKWFMNHFQLKSTKKTSISTEIKLIIAFQQLEESRHDRRFNSNNLRQRTEHVSIININFDGFKTFNIHTFYYGLEGVYNRVNSMAQIKNIRTNIFSESATRYPNGGSNWTSLAAYANWKYNFSTSLILNTGIRYSHILLNSKFKGKKFYNFPYNKITLNTGAVNGSIGLVCKFNKGFNIKSSISSGFRAPNVDDISKIFDSSPGNVVVPNKNLTPEFLYSGELTLLGKINNHLEYNFTGYYTLLVNAMVRRNFTFNGKNSIYYNGELSNVQALVNTGKAFISGISGTIKYAKNGFTLTTTLSYTVGRDLVKDVPLRHTAPLFGKTALSYKWKGFNGIITQWYNGAKLFNELAPSEQNKKHIYTPNGSPSWTTTSVNIQYKINKILVINGGIENLFNHHYRPYSSGISAPGRNFILSVKASLVK